MIFKTPTIETDRMILRPLNADDTADVFEWTGDERVAKYMIYPTHLSEKVTRMWISSLAELENEYTWGCVRKADGKLIGAVSIRHRLDEDAWSLGYNFRFDCWNQGYATEASKRIIRFAYEENGARSFVASHAVDNPASGRVMEKCGFVFDRYTEFSKLYGGITYKAKEYRMKME